MSTHLVVRTPVLSGRVPVRSVAVAVLGGCLLVLTLAWSIGAGDFPIPLADSLAVLAGAGDPAHRFVITELRMPRAAVALVVGASLGLAGALFQTFARNPLASPDVLGITDGASVGAVFVIVSGSSAGVLATGISALGVAAAALAGALLTAAALYLFAWRRGIDGTRFVLIGVGLGAVMTAGVSWMLSKAAIYDLPAAFTWLAGSLAGRGWHEVTPALYALAVLGPVAIVLSQTLRVLQLGDDSARGLGVRLQVAQLSILLVAVCLTAFAVSAAGPIDFVAFVVPQIALRLVGGSRPPLISSAILGALLVLLADTVSRVVLPTELPVGVVTAFVGAPYLLWLLTRTNRKVSA
ncbi:MAG: iron chelate uptake ABC transporter family permease subunit [Propionibacteriales bacterium]|nr:iron chelate uptake ABC transporter family permease subunit [Propionibacteriales bacterium]